MKHKIIYTLLFSLIFSGGMKAQLACTAITDVDLNANGEGLIQASDLVEDVEFFIANGTLTYFIQTLFNCLAIMLEFTNI